MSPVVVDLFCLADIHEVSYLWVCVFGGLRCHFIVIWYMMEREESRFPYLLKHTMGGQGNPGSRLDVREGGQQSINREILTACPVVRQKMCSHYRVLWNVNSRVQLCGSTELWLRVYLRRGFEPNRCLSLYRSPRYISKSLNKWWNITQCYLVSIYILNAILGHFIRGSILDRYSAVKGVSWDSTTLFRSGTHKLKATAYGIWHSQ